MKGFTVFFRIGFSLLSFFTIADSYYILSQSPTFNAVNFFSYFTVLSNIIEAVILLSLGTGVLIKIVGKKHVSSIRGAGTMYMILTGIVYALLLSHSPHTIPGWQNTMLHQVMPVVAVIDWILVPTTVMLSYKHAISWLLFPYAFIVYTLLRGLIVHWYPYPFLNPNMLGYEGVVGYVIVISIGFISCAAVLILLGNLRKSL